MARKVKTVGIPTNVLYVIDGVKASPEEIKELSPNDIEHIHVIKDATAQVKYAGHNGLKSIEQLCGGQVYPRLRFGIGDNYPKGRQVDYVLGPFDKEEQAELPALIDHAVKMIQSFVNIGIELTMTNLNTK